MTDVIKMPLCDLIDILNEAHICDAQIDDLQDWRILKLGTTKENQSESEYKEWGNESTYWLRLLNAYGQGCYGQCHPRYERKNDLLHTERE